LKFVLFSLRPRELFVELCNSVEKREIDLFLLNEFISHLVSREKLPSSLLILQLGFLDQTGSSLVLGMPLLRSFDSLHHATRAFQVSSSRGDRFGTFLLNFVFVSELRADFVHKGRHVLPLDAKVLLELVVDLLEHNSLTSESVYLFA